MITQVDELLREELNETIISQLQQKRKALLRKADLLDKLDEEIQTLIEEDGLERRNWASRFSPGEDRHGNYQTG